MLLVFAFTLLTLSVSEKINPKLVVDYYSYKNVKQLVTFACWDKFEILNYYRYFTSNDMKFSYVHIDDNLDMVKILWVNYYHLGIVLDMDCAKSNTIFHQFTAATLPFNDTYIWLSVTSAAEIPVTILGNLPLTVESELTLALVQNTRYSLYDLYSHSTRHGGTLNVTSMGYWEKSSGFINHLTQYKYKRRQDFHGMALNFSVTLSSEPKPDLLTYLREPTDPHIDTMHRFHYNLVLQLRDFYNFTIHLRRSPSWGYFVNGTFNGIMGEMVKGIVDISVTPFYYRPERIAVCEYTVETYVVKTCFIFRHPKKNSLRNPFLKPFTQSVWLMSVTVAVTCWIVLLITFKIENHYKFGKVFHEYSTSETALTTFAAVSQQGSDDEPQMYSGRIVFITLFFWALIMYQFYSADIVGSLIAAPPKFINTLKDLADSDLHLAFEDVQYTHDYFRTTTNPTSVYLYEKKLKPPKKKKTYTSARDGLYEMSQGGYAFFIDTATGYKIIEDTFTQAQICDLSEIAVIPPKQVSIVTSKRSPFKKMVLYGLRKIVEHGLSRRLAHIWQNRRPNCPESFRSQPVSVELHESSPAMFLVLAGFVFATFVMAAEQLAARLVSRRESTPTAADDLERGQVMP